jgi:hypothetical protein
VTEPSRAVRRCVGGSHDGEDHLCGPASYLHLQHREQPSRYERYVIEGPILDYACEVDDKGMPLTDAHRAWFGYELHGKKHGKAR